MYMQTLSAIEHHAMDLALSLSRLGLYTTPPNPRVGAVLLKNNRILGMGYHHRAGGPHAEIVALQSAKSCGVLDADIAGGTMVVTLEPCCHTGRTGPCVDAIIQSGVARVVILLSDPNPKVAGGGIAKLQSALIEVVCVEVFMATRLIADGLLDSPLGGHANRNDWQAWIRRYQDDNRGFFYRHQYTGSKPFVRLKLAMSLDGRTAMASGKSQWITGERARQEVQYWRARSSAIVTGIGTILADDPALTVRNPPSLMALEAFAILRAIHAIEGNRDDINPATVNTETVLQKLTDYGLSLPLAHPYRQPLRVVLDSAGFMPDTAKIRREEGEILHIGLFEQAAPHYWQAPATEGRINLSAMLSHLYALGHDELWIEAGATLSGAMIEAGLVDELFVFVSPKLLGQSGKPLAIFNITPDVAAPAGFQLFEMKPLENDILLRYHSSNLCYHPPKA